MAFAARIGINPISWTNDDLPSLGGETPLETALVEGKAIGYEGFELGNKFPREPDALRAVLARHGLACVSGWYSGRLARGTVADEIAAVDAHLDAALGQRREGHGLRRGRRFDPGPRRSRSPRRPRFRTDAEWTAYGERVTAFARHTLSRGVRLAYHHHMGAYVETADDVDRLMRVTGPEVGLLHDTGHVTFAGGDAPTELAKHVARVVHVHCKDVRPGGRENGAQPRLELPAGGDERRVQHAGRRLRRFRARRRHPARRRLSRLARRRGRAGSRRRAAVSLRGDGVSVAARRWSTRRAPQRRPDARKAG